LQAALFFWENLSGFLVNELGFELNPHDSCVANKEINGKQCTIIWHVDDLKLSHVEQDVLEDIAAKINEKYGKETPVTVHRGKVHDYLGMTLDFSEDGKVIFTMIDYISTFWMKPPRNSVGKQPLQQPTTFSRLILTVTKT
jgi:hypothetical protein